MNTPTFLHVGCGQKFKQSTPFANTNWREIRLDIDSSVNPDLIGTMVDMKTVENASVDATFSSHNIEHLYPHEVPLALNEFKRVLNPNGFALITCPDLQTTCQLVAEDRMHEPAYKSVSGPIYPIDIIYGLRSSTENGNHYMAHKCGFTLTSLLNAFTNQGFTAVGMRRKKLFDLWVLAGIGKEKQWLIERAKNFFPKQK